MRSELCLALLLPLIALTGCKAQPGGEQTSARSTQSAPALAVSLSAARTSCRDNAGCAANEYCEFQPGLCGKGQSPGACRPRPAQCASDYDPVCACSGTVYDSACAAHAAGEDLAVVAGCKAVVPDFAACGAHYCDARQSYCEIYLSDVFELPTDHFCRPLPETCKPGTSSAPSCDCFPKDTACRSFCGPLATGGIAAFHLTCQGKKPPHS
ncbi:MAG TPA: hypothetical protein VNW92_24590 [Polyangiaceae bacterium]|nr:hypothetical protein [Polyangiaceae bacterium]